MTSDSTTRVARGATYIFIQGLANALLGVLYFIILARFVRPEEMGVFALLVFVLSLPVIFGTLALNTAAVKYIPQYIAQNNTAKARSIVSRLLQISIFSSAVVVVLVLAPAEWLSALLFNTVDYAPLLRIVGLASVFNLLYTFAAGFLQALQRMRDMAILALTCTVVQYSFATCLLYLGWRLYAVAYGWLIGLAFASIASWTITARNLGLLEQPHEIRPLLKYSLPLYIAGGIGFFVGWVDQLILVAYMSLLYGALEAQTMLGVYYVAIRASVVPSLFANSIVIALFPKLSELYTRQGSESLKDAFRISSRYSVLVGFPLIVGLATLALPAINLFAGAQYIGAVEPLVIICIGSLATTLGVAVGPILLTLGRTVVLSILSTVSVLLSLGMSYFALAYLGLGTAGTAWARSLAGIIGLALTLYAAKHYVPISFDKETLWKGSLASTFMVAVVIGVDLLRGAASSASYEFLGIRLHILPVYVVVGGIAYFVALAGLKAIKRYDLELLRGYVPRSFRQILTWLERFTPAD